jgi:hypothetical protein
MTRAIEEIKERLCDELNEYADKNRWSERDVDMIDKITHSIKSLMKYLEMEETWNDYDTRSSYSRGRSMNRGRYYRDDRSYDNSYDDRYYDGDTSYRNRSRDDGMEHLTQELEELMSKTTDADVKEAIKKTMAQIKKNK